eukprot:CAMPEP_0183339326 /NCGR_PEP_ID=MMETSP0164_2-20130417/6290_1 /TAXON_ID=221442 /ORGANISM="Coccolithus pelagicus ssp braarudi, Strain PLY182g" /LENGTH=98 /DNA_ID=CAMNT_0025509297 /DNA_START=146 /DNA_END=439 /DNA_ORIENTATION=-
MGGGLFRRAPRAKAECSYSRVSNRRRTKTWMCGATNLKDRSRGAGSGKASVQWLNGARFPNVAHVKGPRDLTAQAARQTQPKPRGQVLAGGDAGGDSG